MKGSDIVGLGGTGRNIGRHKYVRWTFTREAKVRVEKEVTKSRRVEGGKDGVGRGGERGAKVANIVNSIANTFLGTENSLGVSLGISSHAGII